MAIYTHLPVYHDSYVLLLELSRLMPHLPRDSRYTIGQQLRQKLLDILVLIYRANCVQQKVSIIEHMRETLLEAQVLVRLLCDLRQISERQYTALVERTEGLSKQMAAWAKSERQKAALSVATRSAP